jgi:HCOMODA/2-hydroxy-3-carboxy-muconic semialdehyde decarboxylase
MDMTAIKDDLVTANRILANERVLDSFGHVSIRHPERPDHFIMSRARAPQIIDVGDLMEFTLDGRSVGAEPGKPYSERFIHGAAYEARPEVMAVVHNHSPSVIPFGVTGTRLRPVMHMSGPIGNDINIWDCRRKFGDTNLLVTNMEMGRDLAKALGPRTVSLMRGHGCVVVGKSLREVVFTAIYLELNADLQMKAIAMGGEIMFLSEGEIDIITRGRAGFTLERGWENWCQRVGRQYVPQEMSMGEGYLRSGS